MPSIPIYAPQQTRSSPSSSSTTSASPMPQLLRTPLGLAFMEMQGHINFPPSSESGEKSTRVGRLVFPDWDASTPTSDTAAHEGPWMKKVYFYIGHQRMLGQVKKLGKPIGVLGRKGVLGQGQGEMDVDGEAGGEVLEVLEVLEIVRWKIVFSQRPEPVGEGEGD